MPSADLSARLATLHEIMRALAAEPDTRRLHEAAAQGARSLLDAPAALVVTRGEDRRTFNVEASAGAAPAELPLSLAHALDQRHAFTEDWAAAGAQTVVVPLGGEMRAQALVIVLQPGRRAGKDDLALAELLGQHVALALVHAAGAASSARRIARVEEHAAALRRIAEAHERGAVIERALDTATTLLGADRAAIFLVGARDDVVEAWSRRLSKQYVEVISRGYRASAGALLVRTGAPIYLADVSTDPRTRVVHELAREEGLRSALLVPLLHRGRPLGAVALYHDISWTYDTEDLTLVRAFADQLALSLADSALHAEHARRLRQLHLLQTMVAAGAERGEHASGLERARRALAAMVAGGLPCAWLYLREGRALRLVAHAGASALDGRVSEEAARAALAVRRALTHVSGDAPPLAAAPLGAREPVGALVVAPPLPPPPKPRPGTLHLVLETIEGYADLDPFIGTAAAQLYTLLDEPAAAEGGAFGKSA
jgi:GAF domain-containing protein